jgi:hypothetical protein
MVIEHVFVTTRDSAEALSMASSMLESRGFVPSAGQGSFPVEQDGWSVLEMKRGKKNAARAKNIRDLPQAIRMEWDRGRMTVAMSIGANAAWGGGGLGAVVEREAKMHLHRRLMEAITKSLENLLAHDGTGTADFAEWDTVEKEILRKARRRFIRTLIILLSVIALIVFAVVMIVSSNH